MIEILQLDGRQALPQEFFDIASTVYKDDPFWIPEDADGVRRQFSAENPWFQGREACIALVAGKARLAGFFEPGKLINDELVAFFGFWEAQDDLEANRQAFLAVEGWAKGRGVKRLYGPINFTTYGANRVRLDTFEQGCFPGEPWNPTYYPRLMEQLGYSCGMRYMSFPVGIDYLLASSMSTYEMLKPKVEAAALTVETLSPEMWLENLGEIYGMIDQIFGANFAYTPISEEAFKGALGESFAAKMCPHSSVIARAHDGRIAGFFLAVPDYAPLVNQGNTERIHAGDFNFSRDYDSLPHPRSVLAKTVGVHPDFRRAGLSVYLGLEVTRRARPYYETVVGALIREDNPSAKFPTKHVSDIRNYAMFSKAL